MHSANNCDASLYSDQCRPKHPRIIASFIESSAATKTEEQLIRGLLKNYDPDVRPVKKSSDTVNVTVDLVYTQLQELVRRENSFSEHSLCANQSFCLHIKIISKNRFGRIQFWCLKCLSLVFNSEWTNANGQIVCLDQNGKTSNRWAPWLISLPFVHV